MRSHGIKASAVRLKEPGINLINIPCGAIIAVAFVATNGASFDQVSEMPPSVNVHDTDLMGVGVASNGGLVVALKVPVNPDGSPDGARRGPLPALLASASAEMKLAFDREGANDVHQYSQKQRHQF
jgi:hypothetical protein